jgi:hypothetical protein
MSKIKIQGNASGTGVLTIEAPNTNADRTITLPDVTGELLAKDSSGKVGIGTSSPSKDFVVSNGGAEGIEFDAGAIANLNEMLSYNRSTFAWTPLRYSTSQHEFYTNASERMRIDSAGRVTMPYQPAFHAYGHSNNVNTVGTTFKFSTVTGDKGFNTGGYYSTSTGRFTAPVTGTYQFSWSHIGGNNGQTFRMYLKKNNVSQGDIHLRLDTSATGSEYASNGMYTILYKLSANDYVEIYNGEGTTWYNGSGGSTNDYPRFMGHLIG